MACLQIYRELLSLATFLRVHSNSEEVSYLSWQNMYPNLETTCHIKLKFFLQTKLLENLLLAKYVISVAATLSTVLTCVKVSCGVQIWKKVFCQNSDKFGHSFIKNDIMFRYLLCIYKKLII